MSAEPNTSFAAVASTCTASGPVISPDDWALRYHEHDSAEVKKAIWQMLRAGARLQDYKGYLATLENEVDREVMELAVKLWQMAYEHAAAHVRHVREEEARAWEQALVEDEDRQQSFLRSGG